MSTAIPVQPIAGSLSPTLSPHAAADIPDLNRLLSHGYSARAAVHFKLGDLDAALADLDSALRLFADNSEALHLRGLVHQRRGDQPQAEVDLHLAAHLGWPDPQRGVASSPCELCYRVIGYFGYNFDPVLNTFPLTPEGRRDAIEYAIAAVGDTPTRSEIAGCHDYDILDLRVEVYEHRSITVRRLIHTQE